MSESLNIIEAENHRAMVDKRGLAARYGVGLRTVEAWQGEGIIIGTRHGKRILFDVGDCDRRLLQFKNQKDSYGNN